MSGAQADSCSDLSASQRDWGDEHMAPSIPMRPLCVDVCKFVWAFVNEFGNQITADIAILPSEAGGPREFRYQMAGPSSVVDDTITRQEAIVLRDLLSAAIAATAAT